MHSLFNVGTASSTEEINAIKNNVETLKGNQNILSNQIKQTFNFVNLTYAETNTSRLLFNSLQKDIVQVKHHCPSPLEGTLSTNLW